MDDFFHSFLERMGDILQGRIYAAVDKKTEKAGDALVDNENGKVFIKEYDVISHEYKRVPFYEEMNTRLAEICAYRVLDMCRAMSKYARFYEVKRISRIVWNFGYEFIYARAFMVQSRIAYSSLVNNTDELKEDSIMDLLEHSNVQDFLKNKAVIEKANEDFLESVFPGYKEERCKYNSSEEIEKELFGTSKRKFVEGYQFVMSDTDRFAYLNADLIEQVLEEDKKNNR